MTDEAVRKAYNAWWSALTLKGDPQRRPHLVREAFDAGVKFAQDQKANEAEAQRCMEAGIGANLPANFMEKLK